MPYVLMANRSIIEDKIDRLARYLEINNGFAGFLDWVIQLRLELGIEHHLTGIGIDTKQLDRIAQMATEDADAGSNPIIFTAEQYKNILSQALGLNE